MKKQIFILFLSFTIIVGLSFGAGAKTDEPTNPLTQLPLRNIGPAMISGRIADFAFHPTKKHEFYVATASGNLWKTDNNAITWQPIFEHQGSYSIGVVELDPSNPQIIWVGSGENNSQRSVAYGDGIYKSTDGGKTWRNMGLKNSEHISQIWINPKNSDEVLVAAQGPLWKSGGDRGLYKTTDGGETWEAILTVSADTGVNEFVVNPDNFEQIVASSYQRRRHVWTLINGGPESRIYRTENGGKDWQTVTAGLPKDHMGRIGLAGSQQTIYAVIEANAEEKGVYRSTDFGQNWHKQSSYQPGSPQYYNELIVDPNNPERIYSPSTFSHVSEDGGKSWHRVSLKFKHADDHALWIDPDNSAHLYIGGDGGIYESYDQGETWRHIKNLPIAQFYRVTPDQAEPFYNICGGTQDNNSICGPSRTAVIHGITNGDWQIVLSGDGYEPQIDPTDPNIIYAQYQYGGLARYDRRTKERLYITPHPESGEQAYNWNWNSPLLLSPHDSNRLYYGAEYLFQSDDRGNSWRKISPNLTQQIDRNQLKVMGRVWSVDSIAKNASTSQYGSLIGISESPLQSSLIVTGSDDGQISISNDGGKNWSFTQKFNGVPKNSYVSDVLASSHNKNRIYATFDNHKQGDFKPYVLVSDNQGKSWKNISGDLPQRGSTHTIVEDNVDPKLLFVGTEFGVFFTQNGGSNWYRLEQLPTIAVRDLEIQQRENDLVIGTFGRGIYILDDYRPLRMNGNRLQQQAATLFPIRDTWLYIEGDQYDDREKGSSGSDFFTAQNPPYGAVFRYYLNQDISTKKQQRRQSEIKQEQKNADTPYPSWEQLRNEDQEDAPQVFAEIKDQQGAVVARIEGKTKKGLQQLVWNFRYPAPDAIQLKKPDFIPYWASQPMGPLAKPGTYQVTLFKRQNNQLTQLGETQSFQLKELDNSPELTDDRDQLLAFQQQLSELQRKVIIASAQVKQLDNKIAYLKKAFTQTPKATDADYQAVRKIELELFALKRMLNGDNTIAARQEATPWSVSQRVGRIFFNVIESQSAVTQNHRQSLTIAEQEFATAEQKRQQIVTELSELAGKLEQLGMPQTPAFR